MSEQIRIDPEEAFARVRGDDAVLVCAYDDEDKCRGLRVEGGLTLQEFRDRAGDLAGMEIIFYCT